MSLREKFEQEKKNTLKERYEQEELLKEELLLELNEKAGAQMTALMLKIEKIFAPYYAKLPKIKEGIAKAKLESMKLYSQGLLGKIGNFLRPDSNTVKMKDVELFLSAMTSLLVLMPQILVNAKSASEKPDEQLNKVMDENEINIIINIIEKQLSPRLTWGTMSRIIPEPKITAAQFTDLTYNEFNKLAQSARGSVNQNDQKILNAEIKAQLDASKKPTTSPVEVPVGQHPVPDEFKAITDKLGISSDEMFTQAMSDPTVQNAFRTALKKLQAKPGTIPQSSTKPEANPAVKMPPVAKPN